MSGFRNPFRQHHGSSRRTGAISKTAEREFDREKSKLDQLDEDAKKIAKDTKRCIDCQTAQTKAENKLVQDLYNCPLSREDSRLRFLTDAWFTSSQQLDLHSQEWNATAHKTVAEPMKKFGTIFPSLQQAIKKRDQALQEYNKTQTRVDKYSERDRTGQNIVKLDQSKKEHAKAKCDFEALNAPLVEEMPRLYDGRIDYFTPSFKALLTSQLRYLTEAHKVYTLLEAAVSPDTATQADFVSPFDDADDETAAGEKPDDQKLQQKLAEIRGLSITVDD